MTSKESKLGTHLNCKWLYRVYRNHDAVAYSFLYFSVFLSLHFLDQMKLFVSLFSLTQLELNTHLDNGWMYCMYRNQHAATHILFYSSNFLSLQFSNIKISVTVFSRTEGPRSFKLSTHVYSVSMYRQCRIQTVGPFSSLYIFIFLSLRFLNVQKNSSLFSGSVRPRSL